MMQQPKKTKKGKKSKKKSLLNGEWGGQPSEWGKVDAESDAKFFNLVES